MKKLLVILCLYVSVLSCSKGSDSSPDEKSNVKPEVAALQYPLNNSECISGEIISATKSKVIFEWNSAKNADEYELKLKNLETGLTTGHFTSNSEIAITLDRGTPYSWYVISGNRASGESIESGVWKFYNAGIGVASYAPFPADAISPATGTEVAYSASGITLAWKGTDVDDDIAHYDIYFAETASPGLYSETITTESLDNVVVKQQTKYYWKIKTTDKQGNVSYSDELQFTVK